jgi:hypothetical protein
MPNSDIPVGPRHDEPANPPSAPEPSGAGKPAGAPLGLALLPAAVAVSAGGVILAVAIVWGAAEAAVGVAAAYLVYSAVVEHTDLSGPLAVRLLTAMKRPSPPSAAEPRVD